MQVTCIHLRKAILIQGCTVNSGVTGPKRGQASLRFLGHTHWREFRKK